MNYNPLRIVYAARRIGRCRGNEETRRRNERRERRDFSSAKAPIDRRLRRTLMSRDLHRAATCIIPACTCVTCFIHMMCHASDASPAASAAELPRAQQLRRYHKSFMTSKCHSRNSLPAASPPFLCRLALAHICTTRAIALFKKMHRH